MVAEAAAAAELSHEARQLLRADMTPAAYLEQLSGAGLFADGLKFLACVLGARLSVAWAAVSIRELEGAAEQGGKREAVLKAVDDWVADRSDEKRRAAKDAADAGAVKTPEGCVAMAAFFSEGSMAPAHVQSVPAPPRVAEKLAAGGVLLAVVKQPENAAERFKRCLALGLKDVKT